MFFDNQTLNQAGTYSRTFVGTNGCTTTETLTLKVNESAQTNIEQSICQGESYVFDNQTLNQTGTYSRTFVGTNGCTTTETLTLKVNGSAQTNIEQSICQGESYVFDNQTLNQAGIYTRTFVGTNGCTTTETLTLKVNESAQTNIEQSICQGESYVFDNQTLNQTGTYSRTFVGTNGCTTTETLTLKVNESAQTNIEQSICQGESYVFDNQTLNQAGIYTRTFVGTNGCTTTETLTLKVNESAQTNIEQSICQGESYVFDNQTLNQAGIYTRTFVSTNGCTTTETLTLKVNESAQTNIEQSICQGESYVFDNQTLNQTGIYTRTFVGTNGCTTTETLTLKVNESAQTNIEQSICQGESYVFDNQTLNQTGTYSRTFVGTNGCTTTETLTLKVNESAQTNIEQSICQGESYTFDNQTLNQTGIYTRTFVSTNGCTTTETLTLKVNESAQTNIEQSICQGESYVFDNQTLNQTGTYSRTFVGTNGCTTTETLTLKVNESAQTNIEQTICQGENYVFDNQTLTQAGTYARSFVGTNGCTTTETLNLIVIASTQTNIEQTICQGENYVFDNQTLTQAGTYARSFVGTNGCTTTETLALTVLNIVEANRTENICAGESFIFNGQTLTETGIYRDTLVGANGCDHYEILSLNVLENGTSNQEQTICAGESVAFNNQTLTQGGIYLDTIRSANGCQNIINYTLNVLAKSETTIDTTGCEGESFIFNGQTISASGTYEFLFSNSNGCDSIIFLNFSFQNCQTVSTEHPVLETIKMYPNPVRNQLAIEAHDVSIQQIQIINSQGQIMLQHHYNSPRNSSQIILELSDLTNGIYWVLMQTEYGLKQEKIAKIY